jgi:hypothetical protein
MSEERLYSHPDDGRACRDATGIAGCESVDRYTQAVQQLNTVCMAPEARAAQMIELANGELTRYGIPANRIDASGADGNAGQFDFPTWHMQLDPAAFDDARVIDPALAADAANTVYHESRHTEQWYRMARLRAGLGDDPETLATNLGIPLEMAQLAAGDPILQSDVETHEAQQWYESVYGAGRDHRGAVLSASPLDRSLYCPLPEEADAWAAGASVTTQYPGGVDARNRHLCQ